MSTERILVHSSITKDFAAAFKPAISNIFSQPVHTPILVTEAPVAKNKKLIADALSKGATLFTGDPETKESSSTRMKPIVIEGVNKDMDLYYQESFGPTVSLMTFETEQEAVDIANDTEYGLSAAVFTKDLGAGLRIAKQIESG